SNFPDLVENLDPAKPGYAALIQAFRAPQSLEDRIAYDGASTNSAYGRRHAKVQEVARILVAQPGYADLVFLDESGRIVYTTTKGEDFSLSVADSILHSSGLNRLYERLKGSDTNAIVFEDFADYLSAGEPSAFIGKAVTKRANVAMGTSQAAERIGFVALRVTPTLFDRSLAKRNGLGDTGQILAVGSDGRLRSNPPLNGDSKAGADLSRIGFDATQLSDGVSFTYDTENGSRLASAARVSVFGATWMIVAEQARAEAVASVQSLSRTLALAGVVVLAITAVLGLLAARAIVRPLGALTHALRALAARENLAEVPG
ncbi:chemotaxis protein, partial [Methylobacterium sp. BTF04]|uniref:cache domain-containing protein n=1 Tax=Methylobacterium sp. BTF04 TaxID=2708300 RepID=UPI0014011126